MGDTFYTISSEGEGIYKEKMSKFIAFAIPVSSAAEAKSSVSSYANKYHDARHVCWAYMIGPQRDEFLSSDNGEPSGTAGKPILGQINSHNLTNIVIIVVRYFGGIKLGTSGLISAYREAARLAIEATEIIECHDQTVISFTFPYLAMEPVMRLVKGSDLKILEQVFDNSCSMSISLRSDHAPELHRRLSDIEGVSIIE
ncbi:MAG: YigZ family protein [Muribaculaceae bacterium]|nr:YigZ family protein [Muribaculaceae bacterium]